MQEFSSLRIFNINNEGHLHKHHPLFLGVSQGLYDSINKTYLELFDFYKEQMSCRWTEDEINLEQSRMDLLPGKSKPQEIDLMVKTLALLWELDSVASRTVHSLFAPFVSNPELGTLLAEWAAMENIHALTYSEIIRQCISDPQKAFDEVLKNDEILGRSDIIIKTLDELDEAGSLYRLRHRDDVPKLTRKENMRAIIKGIVALYLLERVQFMSSFAIIFCMAESNRYSGIASLVQLICRDELLHAKFSNEIINILRKDKEWNDVYVEMLPELKELFNEVVERELKWNSYIFTEGRTLVGLNETLLNEWVYYCAGDLADRTDIEYDYPEIRDVPITWVVNWIEMNRRQQAPQEESLVNYRQNSTVNDLQDDEEFDLDNLFNDDVPKNSDNPIDSTTPEVIEDVGCAGGACTL